MWERDKGRKPKDEWYRLCGNTIDGCFFARWNGSRWSTEPYVGEDGHWTAETVVVHYWLRTPADE